MFHIIITHSSCCSTDNLLFLAISSAQHMCAFLHSAMHTDATISIALQSETDLSRVRKVLADCVTVFPQRYPVDVVIADDPRSVVAAASNEEAAVAAGDTVQQREQPSGPTPPPTSSSGTGSGTSYLKVASHACVAWDTFRYCLERKKLPSNLTVCDQIDSTAALEWSLSPEIASARAVEAGAVSEELRKLVLASHGWMASDVTPTKYVYTVETGGYEGMRLTLKRDVDCADMKIIVVTDSAAKAELCRSKGIIPATICVFAPPKDKRTYKTVQRKLKACPQHVVPPNCTYSMYVDSNIILSLSSAAAWLRDKIQRLDAAHAYLMCFQHPTRESVALEGEAILSLKLEKPDAVSCMDQITRRNGYDPGRMLVTETNVLVRRHVARISDSDAAVQLGALRSASIAWCTYLDICLRDQLIFDFVMERQKVRFIRLPHAEKKFQKPKLKHVCPRFRHCESDDD